MSWFVAHHSAMRARHCIDQARTKSGTPDFAATSPPAAIILDDKFDSGIGFGQQYPYLAAAIGIGVFAGVADPLICDHAERDSLSGMGYPLHHGTEQIIALEAGAEPDTMRLRDELEARGVFGAIFCAPATSSKRALVRLTLNSALTEAELEHLETVAREIAPIVKPWDWPCARRARAQACALEVAA